MKKLLFLSVLLLIISAGAIFGQTKNSDAKRWLVFEAEVSRIGNKPKVLCGVVSPYRLAEYKIKKVFQGSYKKDSIIVDHLYCSESVLSDVHVGDTVIVIVDLFQLPAERWSDGVIRSSTEKIETIYVASKVAKLSSCCD